MTNTNAPITDVFPEGERALPGINRQEGVSELLICYPLGRLNGTELPCDREPR